MRQRPRSRRLRLRLREALSFTLLFCTSSSLAISCGEFSSTDNNPASIGADGSAADGGPGGGDGAFVTIDGSAPTDADAAGACAANIKIDPTACGACNHDCAGAACDDGTCVPAKIFISPVSAFKPNSHIAVSGDKGFVTDDQALVGGGFPGYLYTFNPTLQTPVINAARTAQDHSSLLTVGMMGVFYTQGSNGTQNFLSDNGANSELLVDGGVYVALATDPNTGELATRVAYPTGEELHKHSAVSFGAVVSVPVDDAGHGLAFRGADIAVASRDGVQICGGAPCMSSVKLPSGIGAIDVAVEKAPPQQVVFTTTDGDLLRAAFGTVVSNSNKNVLMSGLVNPRAVALSPTDDQPYVLDANGIHTVLNNAKLTVVAKKAGALDFAISGNWIYFVSVDGVFRARR